MANNSLINEEQFNTSIQQLYAQKIFPYLNGATHTGCVPLGTVLPYYGETAPEHFLICDGTEYLKSDYGELATHLLSLTDPTPYQGSDADHFKVPDLRGEFLRGAGTNSHTGQGSGGDVGEHQDATTHPGLYGRGSIGSHTTPTDGIQNIITNKDSESSTSTSKYADVKQDTTMIGSSYYTSRPTNTSVTYIIAYQNAYIDLALDGFPIGISQPQDGQLLMYDATAGRWVNGGHKYSTDEHIVGTWIDGSKVYEIAVQLENTIILRANTWTNLVSMSSMGADKIISCQLYDGIFTKPYGDYLSDVGDGYFKIYKTTPEWSIKSYIIRYTKTTD